VCVKIMILQGCDTV